MKGKGQLSETVMNWTDIHLSCWVQSPSGRMAAEGHGDHQARLKGRDCSMCCPVISASCHFTSLPSSTNIWRCCSQHSSVLSASHQLLYRPHAETKITVSTSSCKWQYTEAKTKGWDWQHCWHWCPSRWTAWRGQALTGATSACAHSLLWHWVPSAPPLLQIFWGRLLSLVIRERCPLSLCLNP